MFFAQIMKTFAVHKTVTLIVNDIKGKFNIPVKFSVFFLLLDLPSSSLQALLTALMLVPWPVITVEIYCLLVWLQLTCTSSGLSAISQITVVVLWVQKVLKLKGVTQSTKQRSNYVYNTELVYAKQKNLTRLAMLCFWNYWHTTFFLFCRCLSK